MRTIINANIITENGILWNGAIKMQDDRIVWVGKESDACPEGEIINAEDCYVGPGFVDIHVHGSTDCLFRDDPQKAAAHFLSHGETSVMPALYHDLKPDELEAAIIKIKNAAADKDSCGNIAGLYMEGPYLNPKYGGSPDSHKWKHGVFAEDYERIVLQAGDFARVWAFSPELDGIDNFVAFVKKVNPNAALAMAHSEATPEQAERFKRLGLKIQTHCTNATGRVQVLRGTRASGPDEYCFSDPDMYAEVICDSQAIHVPPTQQRMILKIKGVDKVILITDSMVGLGAVGKVDVVDLSFDENGDLYGSKLTMDIACRNIMTHTRCGIVEAFTMAALNPAKAVGLDDQVGSIAVGKKANLVITDDKINVKRVILNGKDVR